ncbi:MAG: alpha-ketoglutarate-dependent taurine dioxygenase, partial [Gammaproteobacteria bacterium]
MTSTLQSSRLGSTFFAEISGLELSQKPTAETMLWLSRALVEHKVLLFRNQQLTTDQYARFGRQWTGSTRIDGFTEMNVAPYDDINRVGNDGALFENEDYRNGAAFWHTDCAAEPDPDATTMLYCIHAMAEGGETVFADMQAAYEQLDTETQRNIAELSGLHCYAGAKQILGEKDAWEHNL